MHKIVEMEFGCHVYGTNLPTSDRDYKGVFIPDAKDIILQRVKNTISTTTKPSDQLKNGADDIDMELFSVQQYLKLLLEGQTVALTMLFVPNKHISHRTLVWEALKENKQAFLHSGTSAFAGYCRQQANKYGIKGSRVKAIRDICELLEILINVYGAKAKLKEYWDYIEGHVERFPDHAAIVTQQLANQDKPELLLEVCNRKAQANTSLENAYNIYAKQMKEYGQRALLAEAQEGVDWKACMHAVRVSQEAEELLLTHTITYPRPNADVLVQIRKGELPYKQVAEMIENGLDNLEAAKLKSTLPDKPDYELAEDIIMGIYLGAIDVSYCRQR